MDLSDCPTGIANGALQLGGHRYLGRMLISVEEASRRVLEAVSVGSTETVCLADARGRVVREPVRTPRELPSFNRVMMDGIAICAHSFARGQRRYTLLGKIYAGEAERALKDPMTAWWVMTGAVCPGGASMVVPRESVSVEGGEAVIDENFVPFADRCIHPRGSDASAGSVLIESGVRLDGPEMGVVASCGEPTIVVARRPRMALISSGDELVEPGTPMATHQIPRSNGYALAGLLYRHAEIDFELFHFPDSFDVLVAGLTPLVSRFDFIVCSGGVSMGDRDLLPAAFRALGIEERFHGVTQKPGKPLWMGRDRRGAIVFGLPGNPVSTLVSGRRYVVPAVEQWLGQKASKVHSLPLNQSYCFEPHLTCFLPVRKQGNELEPLPVSNSGDFLHLLHTDGFVELPASKNEFSAGYVARFFPW